MLTEHFSENELGVDGAEARLVTNATFICSELLEPIRAHYGVPMHVHCGYRRPDHNAAVGGKPTSFHLFQDGRCAADFDIHGVSMIETFRWIRAESGLPFDKVILEYSAQDAPACIHIQADLNNAPRRQAFVGGTGDSQTYTEVAVGPSMVVADPEDMA